MCHSRPLFSPYQTILPNQNRKLSGIRTQIVGLKGEHADHLTTTTAQYYYPLLSVTNLEPVSVKIYPTDTSHHENALSCDFRLQNQIQPLLYDE